MLCLIFELICSKNPLNVFCPSTFDAETMLSNDNELMNKVLPLIENLIELERDQGEAFDVREEMKKHSQSAFNRK